MTKPLNAQLQAEFDGPEVTVNRFTYDDMSTLLDADSEIVKELNAVDDTWPSRQTFKI